MLTIGTGDGPPDLEAGVRIAEEYDFVYATAGVHPNDAPKANEQSFSDLEQLLKHPKVKALGEIGLDYHWGVPKEAQITVFVRQLQLAARMEKPVVIHTRDAWDDTLDVLREHWASTHFPCIMHCFTGTPEQASQCIDLDFYLAFGGVSTFRKADAIREAAKLVPENRLLLETDCPYLAPAPYRGKRNEPAFIVHTADVIARTRGVSTEELASQTTRNFERLFGLG